MIKISVVTPSFNQGEFIAKCLASVRKQNGNFKVEHIILDNCSSDKTVQTLEEYKCNHGNVELLVLVEPDGGQTDAINKGFSLATGDIVCWLNTDEWYEDGALNQIADYFAAQPEADVVFGNCDFVDAVGKLVKQKKELFYSESMLIYYGCYIPSCSTFVRHRVINDGVLLNPEFKVTMDFDWYVRIAKAGYCIAYLPSKIASFTWHDTNISSKFLERRKVERRLVQDRYSGVAGPKWYRTLVYALMLRFWLAVRVSRRWVSGL